MSVKDDVKKEIMALVKKGKTEDEIMKAMDKEDAELVGSAWVELEKEGKLKDVRRFSNEDLDRIARRIFGE